MIWAFEVMTADATASREAPRGEQSVGTAGMSRCESHMLRKSRICSLQTLVRISWWETGRLRLFVAVRAVVVAGGDEVGSGVITSVGHVIQLKNFLGTTPPAYITYGITHV